MIYPSNNSRGIKLDSYTGVHILPIKYIVGFKPVALSKASSAAWKNCNIQPNKWAKISNKKVKELIST